MIWVKGRIDIWRDAKKIIADEVKCIDDARAEKIRVIEVDLPWRNITEANLAKLGEIVARHRGRRAKLWFVVRNGAAQVRLVRRLLVHAGVEFLLCSWHRTSKRCRALRFIKRRGDGDA